MLRRPGDVGCLSDQGGSHCRLVLWFILSVAVRGGTGIVFRIDARRDRRRAGPLPGIVTIVTIFARFRRLPARHGVRLRIVTIALAAAIVPSALAMRAPAETMQATPSRFAATPVAQPPERSVVGTLDSIDLKAMQIVVTSPAGKQTLHLQTGVTIRQGAKTVKASELAAHKGERVKVRYHETAGVQQAEWIVLASPTPSHKPKHAEPEPAGREPLPGSR